MHAGSHATLLDVVRHYSEIDLDRLHADGEQVLKPLRLAETEIDDLVAFLRSLTAAEPPVAAPPLSETCQ
jgi:cytochrome c peroxidase